MPKAMSFEDALYNLKLGKTVRRHSWPDTVWAFMVPAAAATVPHKYGGGYHVEPTLWIKTENDGLISYCISQADVLSDDWVILENPQREDQKKIAHA